MVNVWCGDNGEHFSKNTLGGIRSDTKPTHVIVVRPETRTSMLHAAIPLIRGAGSPHVLPNHPRISHLAAQQGDAMLQGDARYVLQRSNSFTIIILLTDFIFLWWLCRNVSKARIFGWTTHYPM